MTSPNLPIPTIPTISQPYRIGPSKAQCRDDNHGIEPVPGRVRSTEVASGPHGTNAQEEFHREEAALERMLGIYMGKASICGY